MENFDSLGIPGPGWLDDQTPCACSRARSRYAIDLVVQPAWLVQLMAGAGIGAVRTFDPKDKSTNASQ